MNTGSLCTQLRAVPLVGFLALGCSGGSEEPSPDGATGGSGGATATGGSGAAGGAGGASTGGSATGGTATGGTATGGTATGGTASGGSATGGSSGAGISGSAGTGAPGGAGAGGSGAQSGAGGSGAVSGSGGRGGSTGCGKMGKTGASQQTMTSAGLERGYYLSVPSTYDSSVPNRLVFGYHGSNYTGIMMRQYLDNERAPLVAGTVFVYPDGLPLPNQPDHVAWVLDEGSRDLVFFDDLLAKMQSEFCIDPERIFVNGQSFGGLMTNAVGCLRGDVVRAIAVVAGSGPRGSAQCRGQVAAWLTHGMEDENVNFSSGEASRDHWVEANHCTTTTMPGMPAQCQNYQGCDAGHPVIWCPHVNDGGHQHPSFGRAAVREFLASF